MSDMFKKAIEAAHETARDLADKGRELADKAGKFAEQWSDHAQEKMDDFNNGLLLNRLETRADELGCDLCIRRTLTSKAILWSVDFGSDTEVVGPDFKTTAEHALEVNTVPVARDPTEGKDDTQHG